MDSYAKDENKESFLGGTNLTFYYDSGAGMNMSFDKGMARYEWVSGPRKGRKAQGIPYNSRKIGDEVYLINWDQPDKPDFITLIFDFEKNVMYSSGLIGYGKERQRILFQRGSLDNVSR